MATITAQMLLGQTHPYDGGVTNVTHHVWLTENSVARWTLMRIDDPTSVIRWIPHPETMLEDGLLMVGLFVFSDSELTSEAQSVLGPLLEVQVMPSDIEIREKLYAINRKQMPDLKVALTIFEGSSLYSQYNVFDHYMGWDVEVCLSQLRREKPRSGWFVSRT
ncbi:hypothetical protein [Paenibacillus sp. LHD-38]|uniref:hypothetical protein n=1 Tax=Paenibacillus sp. LHD-38 TaxID=3072143 RepID=UPI00280EEE93|nr:hypothetical protein [Paenibacillus sp. LHD-38]MDQ8733984.1 hypothetical protein [Paenibacillus sp. LHD-38]